MEENNTAPISQDEIEQTDSTETTATPETDTPETGTEATTDNQHHLEQLKSELEEQRDKYLRLFAEFDNAKRRNAKERIELIQTAGREVISSLLDVLDDCDRAEKQLQNSDDVEQLKQGVQLIFGKLRTTLQSKGLKAMESIHTDFDVEKHEAITEIPAPSEDLKDKVLDEVQKGYYLGEKIIRFAKVVVGK